jgi:2-phospho-L-lactate transferase/gluconeogenesis factor (CofD/UPF0052 family)
MSQPGETTDFCASDHVLAIRKHAGGKILDCVVVSNSSISPAMRRRYAEQNAAPVENDIEVLKNLELEVLAADLLQRGPKVRHNPAVIGQMTFDLAKLGRLRRLAKLEGNGQ